jgi:hypothetical protein
VSALAGSTSGIRARDLALAVLVLGVIASAAFAPTSPLGGPGSSGVRTLASTGPGGNNSSGGSHVDFLESGLPAGTSWSVSLGDASSQSTQTLVVVGGLAAGTYSFRISTGASYAPYPVSGTVSVGTNASASVPVLFTANPAPAPTLLGLPVLEVEVIATVVVIGGVAAVVSEIYARRKPRTPTKTTETALANGH